MAPIKFEESIKETLEKRTILPSTDAWDTLSRDLDNNKKNNTKGLFFYLGIAASIIGICLVANMMFNASENQLNEQIIVDAEFEVKVNTEDSILENQPAKQNVVTKISEENKNIKNSSQIKSSIKNEPKLVEAPNSSNSLYNAKTPLIKDDSTKSTNSTLQVVASSNSANNNEESLVSMLTIEDAKVVEVINQIEKLKIDNGTVSDAEIESLLKQAERDILKDRLYNETTRTVDADALLQDVENDLEQSFRTKVFEGLKSRLKTLKTAVAERNN